MPREINDKIDALFVEGPDDGAVVNALVKKLGGIDLARSPSRVVRTRDEGGGHAWALGEFEKYVETARPGARVGLIVDRDNPTNDKWPAISAALRRLGIETRDDPTAAGAIVGERCGVWMWPDNVSHGTLEDFVTGIIPQSAVLAYAIEACRVAKDAHAAEYRPGDARKAALKVRSVWRDASAAGGYGHLGIGRARRSRSGWRRAPLDRQPEQIPGSVRPDRRPLPMNSRRCLQIRRSDGV